MPIYCAVWQRRLSFAERGPPFLPLGYQTLNANEAQQVRGMFTDRFPIGALKQSVENTRFKRGDHPACSSMQYLRSATMSNRWTGMCFQQQPEGLRSATLGGMLPWPDANTKLLGSPTRIARRGSGVTQEVSILNCMTVRHYAICADRLRC